jgi:glycosidase
MGVAGFRMDAIKHLIEYQGLQENSAETLAWLREYRAFMARELPGTYTIGEIFDGNPRSLAPYYPDQLDYYFEFDVAKATRSAADVGLAGLYLKAVEAAVTALPFQRWSPFLTNHDQNRVMNELDDDPAKAKLAALALLTLPGMPYIYYGEEIGMLGLKPDENIRTPMQWSAAAGAGFTTGAAWRTPQPDYPTKNVAAQTDDPDSLLSTYRRLIQLHVGTPALATGDFTVLLASDTSVAAFLRQSGDERVLVLINFSGEPLSATIAMPTGALPAGTYGLEALFGTPSEAVATLMVGADGAAQGYAPLATLPARTGYIFRLTPAP